VLLRGALVSLRAAAEDVELQLIPARVGEPILGDAGLPVGVEKDTRVLADRAVTDSSRTMSGTPSISTKPPLAPSIKLTRSVSRVAVEMYVASGLPERSAVTLLSSNPSGMTTPGHSLFARLPRTRKNSCLTKRWVKICSLLMSAHTSPRSHQMFPSSG
jgi:hypothetical protein